MMTMDVSVVVDVLRGISDSVPYRGALVFYGAYPITMACVWIVLSIAFARRREGSSADPATPTLPPMLPPAPGRLWSPDRPARRRR